VLELYNSGVEFRNVTRKRRSDGLSAEPFPGELRSRSRAGAQTSDELPRAEILRFEPGDRRLAHLGGDAVADEVVPDCLVAVPSFRKRRGPRASEPPVVEVTEPLQCFERSRSRSLVKAGLREPVVDLATRAVAVAERPNREVDRVARARHRPQRAGAASASSSSSTGVASIGASLCGSRRAETTCSGGACA